MPPVASPARAPPPTNVAAFPLLSPAPILYALRRYRTAYLRFVPPPPTTTPSRGLGYVSSSSLILSERRRPRSHSISGDATSVGGHHTQATGQFLGQDARLPIYLLYAAPFHHLDPTTSHANIPHTLHTYSIFHSLYHFPSFTFSNILWFLLPYFSSFQFYCYCTSAFLGPLSSLPPPPSLAASPTCLGTLLMLQFFSCAAGRRLPLHWRHTHVLRFRRRSARVQRCSLFLKKNVALLPPSHFPSHHRRLHLSLTSMIHFTLFYYTYNTFCTAPPGQNAALPLLRSCHTCTRILGRTQPSACRLKRYPSSANTLRFSGRI